MEMKIGSRAHTAGMEIKLREFNVFKPRWVAGNHHPQW